MTSIFCFTHLVDDTDVRMIQCRSGTSLLGEAAQSVFVLAEVGREQLERDLTTQPHVLSQVHFSHPTFPKQRDDFIRTDPLSLHGINLIANQHLSCILEGRRLHETFRLIVRSDQSLNLYS